MPDAPYEPGLLGPLIGPAVREVLVRLHRVMARVNADLDLSATLQSVVDGVVEGLGWSVATVHLVLADGDVEVVAVAGPHETPGSGLGSRRSGDFWEQVLQGTRPIGDLRWHDQGRSDGLDGPGDAGAWQAGDCLFAPLMSPVQGLIGVLRVAEPVGGRMPVREALELLEMFAVQAALAIDNARLHAQVVTRDAERSGLLDRLTAIVDATPSGIVEIDAEGCIQLWNRAAERIFGWRLAEVVGEQNPVIPATEQHAYRQALDTVLSGGSAPVMELHCRRRDGTLVETEVEIAPVRDGSGRISGCLALLTDITGRKELERRLWHAAQHDALTGLANRRLFSERLEQAHSRARRHGTRLAVLVADLDGFKQVNDDHGHAVGDEVLRAVAARLREAVRPEDVVARLGGDEFVVLIEDVASDADAHHVAARVSEAVAAPMPLPRRAEAGPDVAHMTVGASVGVAFGDGHGSPEAVLSHADAAMYATKSGARTGAEGAGTGESGGSGI